MPTVLLVAASPLDQDRLRLGHEVKKIKQALERSRNREKWTIESNEAVTVDDLRRALLDFRPTVVHFSGHGAGTGGLAFEDDDGIPRNTRRAADKSSSTTSRTRLSALSSTPVTPKFRPTGSVSKLTSLWMSRGTQRPIRRKICRRFLRRSVR